MTKYNLSAIMKRAWQFVKSAGMTISEGLKRAWKEAKSIRDRVIDNLNDLINQAAKVYNYEIVENVWENYGKSRTYFKIVETRDYSKHYAVYDFGYIDNKTDEYHPGRKWDAFGEWTLAGNRR